MTCRETKSRTATAASAIACRLEGDDYRHRLASISELARAALLDHRRDNRSLHLAYAPEAAARVRRMVEEERVCCPFLVIELEETASAVFVGITPPRLDPAMLDILFDHFTDVPWALPAALPRCAKVRFRREASTATQVGNAPDLATAPSGATAVNGQIRPKPGTYLEGKAAPTAAVRTTAIELAG